MVILKKILIYGDSNVWGDNFLTGERIQDKLQWPNILQERLIETHRILQEGLPGRIAGNEEIEKKYKNGKDTFLTIFRTCAPVDTIIIMLGTNDLQIKYSKKVDTIINDLLWYKEIIEKEYEDLENRKKYFVKEKLPDFIYILPINFDFQKEAKIIFNEESEKKRKQIIEYFEKQKIKYISANNMDLFGDGIHLSEKGHNQIANMVEEVIKNEKSL